MLDSESGHEDSYFSLNADSELAVGNTSQISAIIVPDGELLFHADFKRTGDNLTLIGDNGKTFVVPNYFKSETLASL